jgi:hypothetical protein
MKYGQQSKDPFETSQDERDVRRFMLESSADTPSVIIFMGMYILIVVHTYIYKLRERERKDPTDGLLYKSNALKLHLADFVFRVHKRLGVQVFQVKHT